MKKLNKNIFSIISIMAILGMIIATSAVSAAEYENNAANILPDNTPYETRDMNQELNNNGNVENSTIIPSDTNNNTDIMLNNTNSTENQTNTSNITIENHNNTSNSTDKTTPNPTKLLTTGNPILLILFAIFSCAGIYINVKK